MLTRTARRPVPAPFSRLARPVLPGAGHDTREMVGGQTQHFDGNDAPIPDDSTTSGAEAMVENGVWSVYFPVDVQIGPDADSLRIVVNMDHAFRWTDVPGGDNQPGVYDIAPPLYEPIAQFGRNRFDVSVANH